MKQMKQVYNYSGAETRTPELEVGFTELLFRINLCPPQKRESRGLISYSENIVWLSNHTAFLKFLNLKWTPRHPQDPKRNCSVFFIWLLWLWLLKFKLILGNATERVCCYAQPQIHLGKTRTADIDLPYASLLLSQHNSRLVTPLVRAERRYVTFKRERRGGDTKETFQLQLRIRCSPGRLKVSSLITSSLRRELSGTWQRWSRKPSFTVIIFNFYEDMSMIFWPGRIFAVC